VDPGIATGAIHHGVPITEPDAGSNSSTETHTTPDGTAAMDLSGLRNGVIV